MSNQSLKSPTVGADLGAIKGAATPGPEARVTVWARIRRANDRLEDSLLGDVLGAVFLAILGYALFFMAGVLSQPLEPADFYRPEIHTKP